MILRLEYIQALEFGFRILVGLGYSSYLKANGCFDGGYVCYSCVHNNERT